MGVSMREGVGVGGCGCVCVRVWWRCSRDGGTPEHDRCGRENEGVGVGV